MCAIIRIAFGLVLIPYVFVLGADLSVFHGEGGLLPFDIAVTLVDSDVLSPLGWIAPNDTALWFCFWFFCIQVILLVLGVETRFQAFGVFFWLIAFQHRNNLLLDGGDILARLTAVYLMCMPSGERFSVDAWFRSRKNLAPRLLPIWGLKLLQIQMILLYLSTALLKVSGEKWLDGSALMYIVQLDDMFGRFPLPEAMLESIVFLKLLTWLVLLVEVSIPFGLLLNRTRIVTIVVAIVFHLSIDYSMNLFLFQWFMIVGILSFGRVETFPLKWIFETLSRKLSR